jgi:hypothetical protein
MEPIRRCQDAKFFRLVRRTMCACLVAWPCVSEVLLVLLVLQNERRKYVPVELSPGQLSPCDRCPRDRKHVACTSCRAESRRLMEVPPELLEVPELTGVSASVSIDPRTPSPSLTQRASIVLGDQHHVLACRAQADFARVVARSKPSVGPEDLDRFVTWTSEFGEEGV